MHWHTVNNIPGYLPTIAGPLSRFESWEDAREALREDLHEVLSDERLKAMHTYRQLIELPHDFNYEVTIYAAGRAWQILGCQETECETEET